MNQYLFFGTYLSILLVYIILSNILVPGNRRISSSKLRPQNVFFFGYLIPSGFALFNPYLGQINLDTFIFCIFFPSFFFLLGCFFIRFVILGSKNQSNNKHQYSSFYITYPHERKILRRAAGVSLFLGVCAFVNNYVNAVSVLGVFYPVGIDLREWEFAFGASTISNYFYFMLIFPLMFSYYFLINIRGTGRIGHIVKIILITIMFSFHGLKSTILFTNLLAIVFAIVVKDFRNPGGQVFGKIALILFALLAVFIVGSFYLISSLRYGAFDEGNPIDIDLGGLVVEHLTSYISYNYLNLMLEFQTGSEYILGSWFARELFLPFTRIVLATTGFDYIGSGHNFLLFDEGYNAGTIFRGAFIEAGIIGVFVFAFIFGAIAQYFYTRCRIDPNFQNICLYSIVLAHIIFSFYLVQPFRWQFVFVGMLAWLFGKINVDLNTKMIRSA